LSQFSWVGGLRYHDRDLAKADAGAPHPRRQSGARGALARRRRSRNPPPVGPCCPCGAARAGLGRGFPARGAHGAVRAQAAGPFRLPRRIGRRHP
jgi:hypothetical protein